MKKNALPMITVNFMVGGIVPVTIFIDTHLYNRYEFEANAEITMSAGCNIQTNAKMGLSYTRDVGISPILSFTPAFTLYDPTFTAKGSLAAKGSIYPKIEFEIYKCLCPWVEPMPYLRENFEGGMRASTDGNNYLGWTSKSYAGMDCRMGIKMDFGMLISFIDIWTSDIYNPFDYLLLDAPKKIELNSPENGKKLTLGKPIDVTFTVSSFNNITKSDYPCFAALVNFETQGNVNKPFAMSSLDGLATVQWTPKNKTDRLTAKIVDKDGKTISETTFTPEYEDDEEEKNLAGTAWRCFINDDENISWTLRFDSALTILWDIDAVDDENDIFGFPGTYTYSGSNGYMTFGTDERMMTFSFHVDENSLYFQGLKFIKI